MKTEYVVLLILGAVGIYLFTRPKAASVAIQSPTYSGAAANPPYYGPPLGTSGSSPTSNFNTALNAAVALGGAVSTLYSDYSDATDS
jgi:hypothetical protein